MRKIAWLFATLSLIPMVISAARAEPEARLNLLVGTWTVTLVGTWTVTNETTDSTYSGTTATGQVTFFDDHMTIDSGGFAAAGMVAGSEESGCGIPVDPISFKFIGKAVMYVSFLAQLRGDGFSFPQDAVITIVKPGRDQLTMVGEGGCGAQGVSRISYLKRIQESIHNNR